MRPLRITGQSTPASLADALARAASRGMVSECRRFLALGADPLSHDSRPLRQAANNGHLDCVELLIPISDLRSSPVTPLFQAAMSGHIPCIRALLPGSMPLVDCPSPLKAASWHGHVEAVALMLEHQPRAVLALDLSALERDAKASSYFTLAEFWTSLRERHELTHGLAPSPPKLKRTKRARL